MWAVLAALGHWFQQEVVLMTWSHIDDGPRVNALVQLIGVAFLTGLDAIDHAGQLKPGSTFPDLGLVMSIYLAWYVGSLHTLPAA